MDRDRNDILQTYWLPPPDLVETREQSGVRLSYVSHVHTQQTLDRIDPDWTLELDPAGITGRDFAQTKRNGEVYNQGTTLALWGRLTLLGSTRWCVGTCDASKPDAEKELLGDLIRNGAMRHGVFAGLWAKDMPGKAPESHAQPRNLRAAVEDTFPRVDGVSWDDDPEQWTDHHVSRIANLLRSNPDKIMDRLLDGARKKGVDADHWTHVPPEMWVEQVTTFEAWADKKHKERAS